MIFRKATFIFAVSLLFVSVTACSNPAQSSEASENSDNTVTVVAKPLSHAEIYTAADDTLLQTIEDGETLRQINDILSSNLDSNTTANSQEEQNDSLQEANKLYKIALYQKPVAVINDGNPEKLFEIIIYSGSNIIELQASPDAIKNFPIPNETLTSYIEIADDDMERLLSFIPSENETESGTDAAESAPTESDDAYNERTRFEVDFLGEYVGNPMTISLALPEGWRSGTYSVFDDKDAWIGSLELLPIESDMPFADLDEQYLNNPNINETTTKDLVVSGYPAKLYTLRFEALGNGDRNAGTQYLYYVMVDDAYVSLFFAPKEPTEYTEEVFTDVISSFSVEEDNITNTTEESEKIGTGLEHTGTLFDRSLYAVWDEAGLRELASNYEDDAIYTMQNDIQLSAEEWVPIGTKEKPFRGWFTGNTHTISGLTMSDPDAEVIGLFGWASDALITDLTLCDVDISRAGSNVAEEIKSVDLVCAVRGDECRIGVTEVYLIGSDVNIAPELTEEEKADLDSYIDQVLSGNED